MAKRLLIWAVVGAAFGNLIGALLGPRVLSYWFRPPGVTDQDRCVVQIDAALNDLSKFEGVAAAIGLVLFIIIGVLWTRRRGAAANHPPPSSVNPPPAAT
jgi:hypothetical protein